MDPYCFARTHILENMAGIRDLELLRAHEARMAFKRLLQLYDTPVEGAFDLAHLLAIHRTLFQDVYAWAGEIRRGDMALGKQQFSREAHIESALSSLLSELSCEDFLRGLSRNGFAHRAGFYLNGLNAIHPFRDGNGRTQREFLRELGMKAGHKLRWAPITQFEMYNGSKLSMVTGNPAGLVHVLQQALR